MQYKRRTSILISVIFLIFILSCFSLLMPKKSAYALAETESDIISDGDVLSGLEKQKMYYEKLLVNTVENDELEKISNLLGTTEDIIEEYKNTNLNGRNASDSAAVASVISYFSNNNYVLAAELLTHMRDNKDLNSIYIPVNGSRVVGTTAFNNIIGSNYSFGSTTFSNDGSLLGTDAYFSLNKCAYRKASSGKAVVLTDRYDYDTSGYSWTIQGIAVKMMYNAQQSGYLTPFYTVITQEMIPGTTKPIPQTTIDINSTNSRNRFLEEVITLGKGDSKDFSITYEVGGMKVFQTFGNKDTILELYDSQGSLLLSKIHRKHKNDNYEYEYVGRFENGIEDSYLKEIFDCVRKKVEKLNKNFNYDELDSYELFINSAVPINDELREDFAVLDKLVELNIGKRKYTTIHILAYYDLVSFDMIDNEMRRYKLYYAYYKIAERAKELMNNDF